MTSIEPTEEKSIATVPGNRSLLFGIGLLLISGLGFTSSILIASMAIKDGIDVNTSNTVRYFVATALLLTWYKTTGNAMKIMPRERYTALALGIPIFLMGVGYLGAIQYMPVSLAVLIFYTGPFLVIIISKFTENEPITILRLLAISIAFLGLILALEVRSTGLPPIRGILFAFMAAIGMAAINSLLEVDESSCAELNAADLLIDRGRGNKVAIIGHFPFVPRLRQAAGELWVIEQHPRKGDFPAGEAERLLPQADVIGITGTAFTNHTIEYLLSLCRPEAYTVLLGGTAPLSPVLFEHGVDAISGTKVVDPEAVLNCASQGATFRQIRGIRLLTMTRDR